MKVNTASITVGSNGIYAGGGFLGGADALQLTDNDGDGTWEGVAVVTAGTGPNYYAFFNSPSHGGDWGTKEDLNGQSCGIVANYNDRVLPTITSDTTLLHCFGSCETDGSCPAPPTQINGPIVGTWKLLNAADALQVGPNQGDGGSWWSTSLSDVVTRACLFDDSIKFDSLGNMYHYMDGSTWLETWQGVSSEQCGVPVAPHNGGNFTYTFSNNLLTVNGLGAHLGLPKAYNGGELSSPNNAVNSITYQTTFTNSNNIMTVDIQSAGGGNGWWRFIYQRTEMIPAPPPQTYNVTLKVNTASITVGSNGMYAGGGFLGGADALQLTDNDGDGTWEGVAVVTAGTGPNYYAFFNSPSHGGDWGTKEDLNGQSCGIVANYNDRVLPTITSDTTLLHCFGSCETDGSCPAPPTSFIDITFTINVSSIILTGGSIDTTGIFIAGGGNFGNPGDNPMTDLGGGFWSITFNKPLGFTSDYTFTNGNSGWGAKENISGLSCATLPYSDRNLAPVYSDTTIQHCFGTCDYDGSCSSVVIPPNYTFQLDMNQSGYSSLAVPYLRGSWDWGGSW